MSRAGANVNFNSLWKKGFFLLTVFVIGGFFLATPLRVSAQSAPASDSTASQVGAPDLQVTDSLLQYCSDHLSVTNIMVCGASLIISLVLEITVWFLGMMILLVITVLMGFMQYNDFNSAAIVTTGWVVVRDITNMFFIVIILISAFATIVGYDTASFHYKKVLPKLLLMAVLVNFSRTIILLLVDFSQVIMLTFVNAFYQSAAGNFVNGLGLTSVLRLPGANTTGAGTPPAASMFNIVLALALSVVLLSIMLTTMIILTLFIIVRIVGIWIALIFAPAAFLATALPDRLKRGMTAITSGYWEKLVNFLTGGPVIAFFLWLTLSTIQTAGSSSGGLAPVMNLGGDQGAVAWLFPTDAGNSNALASFVVGITLMLMGVGVAVQAAQSASSAFGSLAGKIAGAGQKMGGKLALAGLAAPLIAGRAGARAVDRRADITGRAARLALKVPGVRSVARRPLLKAATFRRREAASEAKEDEPYLKHLDGNELASVQKAYGKTALSSLGERGAASNVLSLATSGKAQKERMQNRTDELMKSKEYSGMDDQGEAKRLAGMQAKEENREGTSALMKEGLAMAQASGDFDEIEKYQKQLGINPQISGDIGKQMGKMRTDPEKLKGMSREAKQSFAVALNALPDGAMNTSADGNTVESFDQPSLERFYEQNAGNKELVETVKLAVDHVEKSDGKGVSKEELMSMQKQRAPDGSVKLYGKQKDGKGYEQKFNEQYKKSRKAVKTALKDGGGMVPAGSLDPSARTSVDNALAQGVQIGDIVKMGDAQQKTAIGEHLEVVSRGGASRAANATDKASFDKAIQDAVNAWKQVDDVDAGLQIKMLSGVQAGGGAKMISEQWDLADKSQRQAMQKMVKQAVLRAASIAKKRASGGVTSAEEEQVETLVSELRKEMPRSKTGTRSAAPAAIRQVLHTEQ